MACAPLPWTDIETVLLDMDGTLLDLHFDNYFWQIHVPHRFADLHRLTVTQAREELFPRFRAAEGTLDWYCVDFWSRELGLDIAALKREVEHLIALRPAALDFLDALRAAGKHVMLVTNAHEKSIAIKMRRTALDDRLDALVSSHTLGRPKEDPAFWARLRERHPFAPQCTLFVDDSLPVLRAARHFGIAWLYGVHQPDSRSAPRENTEFHAVRDFSELMPTRPSLG